MYLTRTIGRWAIELSYRAIHIQQTPDPKCPDCDGEGGAWDGGLGQESPDFFPCNCTAALRHYRIPLWRANPKDYSTEAPF